MRTAATQPELDIMDTAVFSKTQPVATHEEGHLLTIEVVRDVETFCSLHDQWNDMAEQCSATIFQTHEWLFLWWKHFGAGRSRTLHILIIRHYHTIVGIIPLFTDVHTLLGFPLYKRLRLLGCGVANTSSYSAILEHGPSDFLDFLALPQFGSRVAETFYNYIEDHAFICDEIQFENISDESIIKNKLLPWMEALGVCYEIRRSHVCPRLKTPRSVAQYLHGLHSSVRRRLVQAQKTLSCNGAYALETISAETISVAFHDLAALHQARWNRLGYPGLFHDPRFQHFQEDILHAFWNFGWIWFKALRADGVRIAARMGFRFNGRLYDYLSGFDDRPPLSKLRPGLALLLAMVEDAVASKSDCVELLRGKEQYKFELTSDFIYDWNIRFFNLKTTHTVRAVLYRIIRSLEYLTFQLSKERLLLVVQCREHGPAGGVFKYISFRIAESVDRISSWLRNYSQNRNDVHQQSVLSDREV